MKAKLLAPSWPLVVAISGGVFWMAVLGMWIAFGEQSNDLPRYGKPLGLPANCHALISDNIAGWRSRTFTAEEALNSISRNCGSHAPMWRQR